MCTQDHAKWRANISFEVQWRNGIENDNRNTMRRLYTCANAVQTRALMTSLVNKETNKLRLLWFVFFFSVNNRNF